MYKITAANLSGKYLLFAEYPLSTEAALYSLTPDLFYLSAGLFIC